MKTLLRRVNDRWVVYDGDTGQPLTDFDDTPAGLTAAAAYADAPPMEPTVEPDETGAPAPTGDQITPGEPEDPDGCVIPWSGPITFEDRDTSDGRNVAAGALEPRLLPLPLMLQDTTDAQHKGAVVCGRIDTLELRDGGMWWGTGIYIGCDGARAAELARTQQIRGVSADIAALAKELQVTEVDDEGMPIAYKESITKGEIMGATQTPFPAFADCFITPGEPEQMEGAEPYELPPGYESIQAAGAPPARPPVDWFKNPKLEGPTPLTISDDGHVFGHIAAWGECHLTFGEQVCITAPSSPSNYAYFLLGATECDDGTRVPTGAITLNTGHADRYATQAAAVAHYDDTGTAVADVMTGEDAYGIWVAGAMRPGVDDNLRRTFTASVPSGDWRKIQGNLELVACLMVNTPGFPVPRVGLVASADGSMQEISLVAAAAPLMAAAARRITGPDAYSSLPAPLLRLITEQLDREVLGG